MNHLARRIIAPVLAFILVVGPASHAGVISTGSALQLQARDHQITRVTTFLAREDVHKALIARGVNPTDAAQRIDSLSDSELEHLAARIDELPAGGTGVIEVIGIVAVVLIVLELLGVTDVFTRI